MCPDRLYQITGQKSLKGLFFIPETNLEKYWAQWKHQFINIEAAGGVVRRPDKSFLAIYRLGKWDLPKGKAEEGETPETTAVREVEEECGIEGVSVIDKLTETYHVYPYKDGFALKRTHWFLLNWNENGEFVPQAEEGIEELRWFDQSELDEFYTSTYGSVAEVVRAVFSTN